MTKSRCQGICSDLVRKEEEEEEEQFGSKLWAIWPTIEWFRECCCKLSIYCVVADETNS